MQPAANPVSPETSSQSFDYEPFEFMTELTLDECLDRLRNLEQPRDTGGDYSSRTVEIRPLKDGAYEFTIKFKRYFRWRDETHAIAKGVIRTDRQTGKTFVAGATSFGILNTMSLIILGAVLFIGGCALCFYSGQMRPDAPLIIILGAAVLFAFVFSMKSAQKQLHELVKQSLSADKTI
jgi:hypothetical protein